MGRLLTTLNGRGTMNEVTCVAIKEEQTQRLNHVVASMNSRAWCISAVTVHGIFVREVIYQFTMPTLRRVSEGAEAAG